MSLVARNLTNNQGTYDTDRKKLLVFGNSFKQGVYSNVSGALESAVVGQVVGVIAATGEWTICKSAAIDGSAVPRGILFQDFTDLAIAGTIDTINVVNGGKVRKDMIVFDGTDDFDTLVGGVRMEDLLIGNSKDLELVIIEDDTKFDN